MNRYSPLIRKLIDATAEAEMKGEDIADTLRHRCFDDTSIIRRTLMNAVCDPRFKLYASTVGFWKEEAKTSLEELAAQLSAQEGLTEDEADAMLESFLSAWFSMTYEKIVFPGSARTGSYFKEDKLEEKKNLEDGLKMLEELEASFLSPQRKGNPTMGIPGGGNKGKKSMLVKGDKDGNDNTQEELEQDSTLQEEQRKTQFGMHSPGRTKSRLTKIEERYLENIPVSLVELARKIGRMGEVGSLKAGRFLTASRSDISGITAGNAISAVLPSELALLAEPKTQNIFWSNYAASRLQVFASASQVKSQNKHQDGPVIICVDTSSSMTGEPVLVARALAVAVSIIAWRRKRSVFVVKYSDTYDYINLGDNNSRLGELSRFLSIISSGGNNENAMFQWLFKDVVNNLSDYDSADILCVSDFGWTEIATKTERLINENKLHGMRLYGLNVQSGMFRKDDQSIMNQAMAICDSVWTYSEGVCKEVKKYNPTN